MFHLTAEHKRRSLSFVSDRYHTIAPSLTLNKVQVPSSILLPLIPCDQSKT